MYPAMLGIIISIIDYRMNPLCMACGELATRVCVHPDCQLIPFLCPNKCRNKVGQIAHTHNQTTLFIPYSQLEQYISKTGERDNSALVNKFKKRIKIIQQTFDTFIQKIDKQFSLSSLKLSSNSLSLIQKITSKENQNLRGKDIKKFMEGKDIFQNQSYIQQEIKKIQNQLQLKLTSIQSILDSNYTQLMMAEEIKQVKKEPQKLQDQFLQHFVKGIKSKKSKQKITALNEFFSARQYNPFQPQNQHQIAQCLSEINQYDLIQQYKRVIDLGSESKTKLNSFKRISELYIKKEDFKMSLKYINQCLKIQCNPIFLNSRGMIYMCMEDWAEGLVDFTKAIGIRPNKLSYTQRAQCYNKLDMKYEAIQDIEMIPQVQAYI